MWFDQLIEQMIQDAIEQGLFDNLPGKGKPIDHSAYFAVREDMRLSYAMLKNSGFIPEEVQLLKDIGMLRAELEQCVDEEHKQVISRKINKKRLRFDLIMEQYRRRRTGPGGI